MASIKLEWERNKAAANAKKHDVSLEQARSVFSDQFAKLIDDPAHSEDEDRFSLLGFGGMLRILVVYHCYRAPNGVIRIISARKASSAESTQYTRR